MAKAEFYEGPEAADRFKRGMQALFKVPKEKVKRQPKKATARKTRGKKQG